MDAGFVPSSPAPRVSVVVVSFNTKDKLRRCLSCIEARHEVVVVDNGSSDGSADMVRAEFPDVRLIQNSGNVGFGAANNQGMELAMGKYVLFLNSDAYAEPGAIDLLASKLEGSSPPAGANANENPIIQQSKVKNQKSKIKNLPAPPASSAATALSSSGAPPAPPEQPATVGELVIAVGGRLLNPDGSLQESAANELTMWAVFCEQTYLEKLFKARPFFSPYWVTSRLTADCEVAQVMGACLMMRPLERFDERFFVYCEDTDICKRLSKHGRILYVPEARFTHDLGSSSAGTSRWLGVARYNRGKELYFAIHRGPIASATCWVFDRLGALSRLVAYGLMVLVTLGARPSFRKRVGLWLMVLTAPLRGPDHPPRTER